jgi:hypothetical protein
MQSHAETNGNSGASLGPASSYIMDTLLAVDPSSIGMHCLSLSLTGIHPDAHKTSFVERAIRQSQEHVHSVLVSRSTMLTLRLMAGSSSMMHRKQGGKPQILCGHAPLLYTEKLDAPICDIMQVLE